MPYTTFIIIACWIIFILVWGIAAIGVKKDKNKEARQLAGRGGSLWIIRAGITLLILWSVIQGIFKHANFQFKYTNIYFQEDFLSHNAIIAAIGAVFCILGIGFAVWARFHLGRDWSSHPTIKEEHSLVTSGPYTYVRHPIYTGMLLAILGSALSGGLVWLFVFIIVLGVFLRRVQVEEVLMTKLFPDQYPEYKKHSKALIPFVW